MYLWGEIQEEVSQKQWSGICECFSKESNFFCDSLTPVLSSVECVVQYCISNELFLLLTS